MRTSDSTTILFLAASSISSTQAQSSTNTTTISCGGDIDWLNSGRSSANSTGQVEFKWTDSSDSKTPPSYPWYVSVTINDTLQRDDHTLTSSNKGIELRGYVSVPDSVKNASLCLWRFDSANVTLDGSADDGLDSCGGIVSDECMEFFTDDLQLESSGSGYPRNKKAGNDGSEAFKKACPNLGESVAGRSILSL